MYRLVAALTAAAIVLVGSAAPAGALNPQPEPPGLHVRLAAGPYPVSAGVLRVDPR